MNCRQCGREVDVDGWKFCPHCGGGLQDERVALFLKKIFQSKRNIAIFFLFDLLLIGSVAFLFFSSRREIAQRDQEIRQILEKKKEISVELETEERVMPVTYFGDDKRVGILKIASPIYGRLSIEMEIPGIAEAEKEVINIKPESRIFPLSPEISEAGYRSLTEPKETSLHLKVSFLDDNGDERILLEKKEKIFFYSKNDIVWANEKENNFKYLARWINKDRDEIRSLVRLAADHMKELGGEANALVGNSKDKKEVERELKAIFLAISKDYQVRYIAAPFSYDDLNVQRVKTPEEVLGTKSGLCIELSLLTAAALEHIGLNPVVVVTTGHAWAGVELSPRSQEYVFIETTALDRKPDEAVAIAQKEWEEIRNNFSSYRVININELRAEGMIPMRY